MRWPVALMLSALPVSAEPECRQALVLAIDVSASVDRQEYRLQAGGLAWALRDPTVRQAFLVDTDLPVALAVFEWSGADFQRLLIDWTMVRDDGTIDRVAQRIEEAPMPADQTTTGIGAAMLHAAELFARGPECIELTLDISGDGQNNDSPRPEDVRREAALERVTINGLVIGADFPREHALNPNRMGALTNYYESRVIKGPGAFVETADDFNDFGRAMRRKLIRELSTMVLGRADTGEALRTR